MPGTARLRITRPLPTLDAWVNAFASAEIPVLAETAAEINSLRELEDDVNAHQLTGLVTSDPLMSLKVLAFAGELRRGRLTNDTETVTAALVLMGISPFFRNFSDQPTLEERLADNEEALLGLSRVLQRAERASRFALSFAAHRADPDAAVITGAALLHDFAEMLLWVHAPDLALEIARRQEADSTLRSAVAQREVLGIELHELEQALMRRWHLPALLMRITDDKHARDNKVRCVYLAVRLARHLAHGWDNAALPDDLHDIAELLNLNPAHTLKLLHEFD